MKVRKTDVLWRWLGSKTLFLALGSAIIGAMILGTVFANWDVYQSVWFKGLQISLMLSLIVCTIRRFCLKVRFIGPTIIHFSVILILSGSLVGDFFAEKGRVIIAKGNAESSFLIESPYKGIKNLDFFIGLKEFNLEFDEKMHDGHQHVKNYQSVVEVEDYDGNLSESLIEVNSPLKYGGYTFYQFSYDDKNLRYTVLGVARDPGVPIIYAGFIVLTLGLIFQFYGIKLIATKKERGE